LLSGLIACGPLLRDELVSLLDSRRSEVSRS
jgi:hypothetical protein